MKILDISTTEGGILPLSHIIPRLIRIYTCMMIILNQKYVFLFFSFFLWPGLDTKSTYIEYLFPK